MYDLLTSALKLDVDSKRVVVLLLQESILKDDALAGRIDTESDDNLATFLAMGEHGHSLKKKLTIASLLDSFILSNRGLEYQREHIVLTLHHQALCGGLTPTKEEVSKRLTKLVKEKGIATRRNGNIYYWTMP